MIRSGRSRYALVGAPAAPALGRFPALPAVIEHANRRIRILGTTAHLTAGWVAQAIKNLVMDLEDVGCRARYLIGDRDGKFPAILDDVHADAGIQTVLVRRSGPENERDHGAMGAVLPP